MGDIAEKLRAWAAGPIPEWINEPWRFDYRKRRLEETEQMIRMVESGFDGDWTQQAASILQAQAIHAPQQGSAHHAGLIVAKALSLLPRRRRSRSND